MKKYGSDDFVICTNFRPIPKTIFDKMEPATFSVMNKWTGDKYGPFDTVADAQNFIKSF